ncbi:MAG: hypothetical protein HXX20_15750 [Chloroflexi bacterium]|nr:hypothetical protein [Chloroflexota bacterium]
MLKFQFKKDLEQSAEMGWFRLLARPTHTEKPEERRRRFVLNISLLLIGLVIISSPFTFSPLTQNISISNLLVDLVMILIVVICVASWFIAKAGKIDLGAGLLISSIMIANTMFFLFIYHDLLSVISYPMIAIIALIILGVKAAYTTMALSSIITILASATGNFFITDRNNLLSIKIELEFTLMIVLIMTVTVWLAAYLASNLSHANTLVNRQAEKIGAALADIEKKRAVGEDVSHRVFSLTTELNATANQQMTGSKQQASALAQVTSFVQEMTNTAQMIASKTNELSQQALQIKESTTRVKSIANEVNKTSKNGVQAVDRTLNSNQQVSERYTTLKEILNDMEEQQDRIKEVVLIIKEISAETHMLALNASIEASGAGEHGERFSVVAREVKTLADRSNRASREVGQILGQIESQIKQAVSAAEISHQEIRKALEAAQDSGLVMNTLLVGIQWNTEEVSQIEQVIGSISTQVGEINYATSQQYQASNQTLETLQDIGIVAAQNASGSLEITKSAEFLEKLSQGLLETLT